MLQDKWAILLSNLVDSDQNIQNHVFPYILGQISSNEFMVLENVFADWRSRVRRVNTELEKHKAESSDLEASLKTEIAKVEGRIEEAERAGARRNGSRVWDIRRELWDKQRELRFLSSKERTLVYQRDQPEEVPEESLREFELSNLTRLGLIRLVQEPYAENKTVDLPDRHDEYSGGSIDIEIEVYSDSNHILTELGILFIQACTEKRVI
ncbi:MAG: hypothetical protein AAFP18_17645 [Bacteroidota bacterium]